MTFDTSRHRFDPASNYFGVIQQQGRMQSDADWTELVAQVTRRLQAGTLDTMGRAVVPLETPDGFRVRVAGDGTFTVDPGRLYVDGILAENHGDAPAAWDPRLAERRGTAGVGYGKQPYLPDPPALPTSGGPHLVYLDVWQREVTYLQDPSLVDPALGVDTTGRLQAVWQVRVLADVGPVTCATPDADVPGWADITRPSAGRLSTRTADPAEKSDPCTIPPAAGYRGLENQHYRVEIHDGGAPGTATFKWSRDNGTVATRVTGIDAARDRLVVESVGRDAVLRFSDGDWVEVTDDRRELQGLPGVLRRIRRGGGVDDATRTIRLETPLPSEAFTTDGADRHTRIRRWDQAGVVLREKGTEKGTKFHDLDASGATGAIPVPADGSALFLEDGIVVQFEVADKDGAFRPGDAWTFAARTADASIERLEKAPPRSVHHHYARLALVTFPSTVVDCRTPWPPAAGQGGCCTQVVAPGESIQAAIDALPDGGGCVCLRTGEHPIADALRIRTSNVSLHGSSPGVVVRRSTAGPLLTVGDLDDPQIERVSVAGIRWRAGPAAGAVAGGRARARRARRSSAGSWSSGAWPERRCGTARWSRTRDRRARYARSACSWWTART
jgi:hypothetical protein